MNARSGNYDRTQTSLRGPAIEAVVYPSLQALPTAHLARLRERETSEPAPLHFAATISDTERQDAPRAAIEQRIVEETKKSYEAGRLRGHEEAILSEREAQNEARSREDEKRIGEIARVIQRFDEEHHRYLVAVEQQVVNLALAIAARILRREAQMDALLLTGAVRVALGQLADSTQARLRVPAGDLSQWKETIEHIPNLRVRPKVLPDEGMRLGDCIIETELGTVDLGISAQLGEIERGFFDRPARTRAASGNLRTDGELPSEVRR